MLFRRLARRSLVLAALAAPALPARAQSFPSRAIRIIVPFGAGGTADTIARLYGQRMSETFGVPVIVENRPGGNQLNAIRMLMASPPDGYTLMAAVGSALVQNPALQPGLPYDPLKDFTLLGLAVTNPAVIFVNPALPIRSMNDLVAHAKAHPGALNYASAGVGTAGHLHVEALMSLTGIEMTHVAYRSAAEVGREVMTGTVQLGIMPTLDMVSFIQAGQVRPLAVTTASRLPYLPDVPSLAETGIPQLVEMEPHTFISFVGPAGMAPETVARLNQAINAISSSADTGGRVRTTLYAEPVAISPDEFRTFVERELAKWRSFGRNIRLPPIQ